MCYRYLTSEETETSGQILIEVGVAEVTEQNFAVPLGDVSVMVLTDWPRVSGIWKVFRLCGSTMDGQSGVT